MQADDTKAVREGAELLPCPNPWCDAADRVGDFSPAVSQQLFGNWRVGCTSCSMDGPSAIDRNGAISAWNTRAHSASHQLDALANENAALREAEGWAKATAWHKYGVAWKHLERVSQVELLIEARAALAKDQAHGG